MLTVAQIDPDGGSTVPNGGRAKRVQTVELLVCIECSAEWLREDPTRWRAYLTSDDPPEVLIYCEVCASREFGNAALD